MEKEMHWSDNLSLVKRGIRGHKLKKDGCNFLLSISNLRKFGHSGNIRWKLTCYEV